MKFEIMNQRHSPTRHSLKFDRCENFFLLPFSLLSLLEFSLPRFLSSTAHHLLSPSLSLSISLSVCFSRSLFVFAFCNGDCCGEGESDRAEGKQTLISILICLFVRIGVRVRAICFPFSVRELWASISQKFRVWKCM